MVGVEGSQGACSRRWTSRPCKEGIHVERMRAPILCEYLCQLRRLLRYELGSERLLTEISGQGRREWFGRELVEGAGGGG